MSSSEKVTARSHVKRTKRRSIRMPTMLRIVSPANFLGLGIVAALALVFAMKGTPHLLFEYTYTSSKSVKITCTYLGLHSQTVSAIDHDCPVIRILGDAR